MIRITCSRKLTSLSWPLQPVDFKVTTTSRPLVITLRQWTVMWHQRNHFCDAATAEVRKCRNAYETDLIISISCRPWRTRATRCITAKVLQTKVDAQCDKLATELSWQRLRRLTFSSYSEYLSKVANFNLPHLHLAPPLGVIPFEFCGDLRRQKTRAHGLSCGIAYVLAEFRLVAGRQTDRQTHEYGIYRARMASIAG